jgi:uncharacterized protein (TIGR02145 family)
MAFKIGSTEVIDDSANLSVRGNYGEAGEIPYVVIGTQTWMAKNLEVTRYRNGDNIPCIGSETDEPDVWEDLTTGACTSWWGSGPLPIEHQLTYGLFYNWHAVGDDRGLAPEGWRIPTNDDIETLLAYVDGSSITDGSMIAGGEHLWDDGNLNNSSDFAKYPFNGLPAGNRAASNGANGYRGTHCYWWGSDEHTDTHGYAFRMYYDHTNVLHTSYDKRYGYNVRCIRDTP